MSITHILYAAITSAEIINVTQVKRSEIMKKNQDIFALSMADYLIYLYTSYYTAHVLCLSVFFALRFVILIFIQNPLILCPPHVQIINVTTISLRSFHRSTQ